MELIEGGDLYDIIEEAKGINESDAIYIIHEVLLALNYIVFVG